MFILILFNYQHSVINWKSLSSIKATRTAVCAFSANHLSLNQRQGPNFLLDVCCVARPPRAAHCKILYLFLCVRECVAKENLCGTSVMPELHLLVFSCPLKQKARGAFWIYDPWSLRALARGSKDERKGSASRGCFQTVIFDSCVRTMHSKRM